MIIVFLRQDLQDLLDLLFHHFPPARHRPRLQARRAGMKVMKCPTLRLGLADKRSGEKRHAEKSHAGSGTLISTFDICGSQKWGRWWVLKAIAIMNLC